jgi:mannose-1-phosphate guanylyltransferase/mannose-6-phosphate isomerase
MIRPVILCGGAGTRLWPVSRQQFPKQFLQLIGDQSLLQQTVDRVKGNRFERPIIVSGQDQSSLVVRQLREVGATTEAVLLEPVGRNTAAAATLAAAWLHSTNRDELLLLMPSDHVIGDREAFLEAIEIGLPHAIAGAIVTFGALPSEPNTQYGYIESEPEGNFATGARRIARFHEKPNAERAASYLATGRFFWNCGIFLMKSSTLLDEMRHFLPGSLDAITHSISEAMRDGPFVRASLNDFGQAEDISIDNGIMEKTCRGVVVPVQMDWSDVGAWDAVWKLHDKDDNQNVIHGNVVALDTHGSLILGNGRSVVATVGVEDLAVIAVNDAIFIAPKKRASEVKELVSKLTERGRDYTIQPERVIKDWGSFEPIADGACFRVKHITVDPGKSVTVRRDPGSLGHWIVARGSAELTVGTEVLVIDENRSTAIPAGVSLLANRGAIPLELVEVHCGAHSDERGSQYSDPD